MLGWTRPETLGAAASLDPLLGVRGGGCFLWGVGSTKAIIGVYIYIHIRYIYIYLYIYIRYIYIHIGVLMMGRIKIYIYIDIIYHWI